MIIGKKKEKSILPSEAILKLISSYDIFKYYLAGRDWKVNQKTNSPFRKDEHPSFIIGSKGGELHFLDFADTQYRGNCFKFVQMLFHIEVFADVYRKIDNDFGLGIFTKEITKDYKQIISQYVQPESLEKSYSLIQAITRKFRKEELEYWERYYQTINDLKANNIYSIKCLFLNRQKFCLPDEELRFGYLYEGGFWKLYRPFNNKKSKWVSNVPLATAYGLNNLNKEHNTLICKSLKDYLVCRKVYDNVCHIQNESLAAFSHETIEYIKENSREVFYAGDSDRAGKEASYAITRAFGYKHINPVDRLLPEIKDWADWARVEGLDAIKNHFIKKGLL
jgi:hypothetical protein